MRWSPEVSMLEPLHTGPVQPDCPLVDRDKRVIDYLGVQYDLTSLSEVADHVPELNIGLDRST